jgi:hypothetical protein
MTGRKGKAMSEEQGFESALVRSADIAECAGVIPAEVRRRTRACGSDSVAKYLLLRRDEELSVWDRNPLAMGIRARVLDFQACAKGVNLILAWEIGIGPH